MSANTEKKTVIALGFFDGVHRGHAELIKMAKLRAQEKNAVPAVLSFDVSPESVITGRKVPLIGSVATRTEFVRKLFGIENVIIYHFDKATMETPWRDFVDSLIKKYHAVHLIIGHDFKCGYKGEGDSQKISEYCSDIGVGCDVIPKFTLDGITVSSTYIRELIGKGEIEKANYFLGHPYLYAGTVMDGRKVGRKLGTPTINLDRDDENLILPAKGVYATKVNIDGTEFLAVTNIGVRPTFGESDKLTVETYILDYEGDLYGKYVRIEFFEFLRAERKFDSAEDLSAQIAKDIEDTRLIIKCE